MNPSSRGSPRHHTSLTELDSTSPPLIVAADPPLPPDGGVCPAAEASNPCDAPKSAPLRADRSADVRLILWPREEDLWAWASRALPALVRALLRPGGRREGQEDRSEAKV